MARKRLNNKKYKYTDKPSFKWVVCSKCHTEEVKVSVDAESAICWLCVVKMSPPPAVRVEKPKSSGRPKGWHLYGEFVDKDGNVFHKGKEQPELKGTLPPTEIEETEKKNRKSKFQREQERIKKEAKLAAKYKRKQEKINGKPKKRGRPKGKKNENSKRRKRIKKTK